MATKFYKRIVPTKAVFPNAVYSDLYDNNKTTTDIQSGNVEGIESSSFIIGDYTLPSKPSFGNVELVGAKLGLYINTITQGGSGGTAGLKAFKLGMDIGGAEGGKGTAGTLINNQDIVQVCSYHDETSGYIEETFSNDSGTDEVKEAVEMTLLKKIGPYIEEEVGYDKGQNYGMATGLGLGSAPISQVTHKKRFGQKQEDDSYIYKLEKEKQWGVPGWKSIKKHGNWWRRNEEWWKANSQGSTIKNDIKYIQEVTVDVPPEDRPTQLTTENSFFDVVKHTETYRTVQDDSNTLKREHYNEITHDTKTVLTGGGSMGLSALYTHRNNSDVSPLYGKYSNPTKIVNGLPVSTEVTEATLQQVAFASKAMPMPIDSGNSQTPMRAAAGTHSPVPTVEIDINFQTLAPMLVRSERSGDVDDGSLDSTYKYRLNRSVVVTFGELKPDNSDSLYSYTKRHLPLSGSIGTGTGRGNGQPMQGAFAIKCEDGDAPISGSTDEQSYIKLESTDGTIRVYVLCDAANTSVATGDVITSGSDTGTAVGGLHPTIAAFGTCIAFSVNLSTEKQGDVLDALRTAIVSAAGHNGRILCGNATGTSNTTTLNANGNQFLHLTQNTGGEDGNTSFTEDLDSGNLSFVISADTSVSTTSNKKFQGGLDSKTFFGSAFINVDGELCHKAIQSTGDSTEMANKDVSVKCDDDLGEVCFNDEPTPLGDGGNMNNWLRTAYQLLPDYPGARMSMYEPSTGDFILKPQSINNCRSENLNMATSGSYPRVSRLAVNRNNPAKYMTVWVNNYQAVKGGWDSNTKSWKTGLKQSDTDAGTDLKLYIDDPATGEKSEGGDIKSQAWQLIKPKTAVRIQNGSATTTEVECVSTINRTSADSSGFLQLTITNEDEDAYVDGIFGYDSVNLIDSEISKGNVDTEISVNIDAIRFKKFNLLHQNATPASNNIFPRRLNIPTPAELIPFNFNLNLSNTSLENVYDHKTYQPSYLSFGFSDWYDMVGTSSAIMTKDSKKLLLNDFQMGLNNISDKVIINPDSRFSHVRAGYTSYEARGLQCKNVLVQSVAQTLGDDDLQAGYQSNVSDTERTSLNSLSQLFDNAAGTPTFTKAGLKIGTDTGTVGTNHDISIGANAANQIDYFSQKGILEWKFSPRTTASSTNLVSTGGQVTDSTTATLATVGNGALFTVNQHILINTEIMKVTAINTNVLTVERGAYGTTAATHAGTPAVSHIAVPEKRENIFCSARLLTAEKNTITVDSADVLKQNAGEEFIVYKYGDSHVSPTFTPLIVKIVRIGEEVILDTELGINNEDAGSYLISPYRYWLIIEIMNVGGETTKTITANDDSTALTLSDVDGLKVFQQIKGTSTTIQSISGNVVTLTASYDSTDPQVTPVSTVTFETGSWQGNNQTFVRKYLPDKSYSNAVGISESGTFGCTLNESLYNDGAYINSWNLEAFENSEETAVILKDYGFGEFDEEKALGGHAGYLPLNIQGDTSKFKEVDVTGVITTDSPDFGDTLTFIISTDDPQENFKINVDTESGTNPLYMLTVLKDELMEKPDLSVNPDTDNAFYPKFKWSQSSKDAWYGFLIVDDENIENQYKNAVIHYPFNESGSHGKAASAPVESISGHATTISGALYDVEGLAGNCLRFDGANDVVICTPSPAADPTYDGTADTQTEMSVVAHIVPDADISGENIIISQYDDNTKEKFKITLNASKQIEAVVVMKASSLINATLTSSSIIPTNGETPTSIILTVDTTLKSGNVKLYINGKLEDLTGASLAAGTTNNWETGTVINGGNASLHIGRSASSSGNYGFDGKIEEVVVYKKCIYPVVPNVTEFLFTKPSSELVSGQSLAQSKSNTAKLFVKDYHNIRGSTEAEVASSSQVSWRKAGFALDTT